MEKQIFEVACDETGINLVVLGNDVHNLVGRPSLHEMD